MEVIKRLMYFIPPKECSYKVFFSNIFQAILSDPMQQSFQLVLIKFQAVQSQHFKFRGIFCMFHCCSGQKKFFMKLQKIKRISNKTLTKRGREEKSNINGIISFYFRRLKNTLNNKIQESRVSHAREAILGLCMANYTLVPTTLYHSLKVKPDLSGSCIWGSRV